MQGIWTKSRASPLTWHYYGTNGKDTLTWVLSMSLPTAWVQWSLRLFAQLSPLSVMTFFPPHSLGRLPFLQWPAMARSLRNLNKQRVFYGLRFLENSCPPCTQPAWTVRSLRARLYPPSLPLASTGAQVPYFFSLLDASPDKLGLTKDRSIWFMAQQKLSIMAEGPSPLWLHEDACSCLCQSGSREKKRKGPVFSSPSPFPLFIQSQTTAHGMIHPHSGRLFFH